jgi:pyruvate formate lyase activating enzyme
VETRCIQCGECHDAVDGPGQVAACPTGARRWQGETWTAEALVTELLRDRLFFDESGGGVTIGDGEADARTLHEVAGRADLVLYDLKHMDPAAHHAWAGVDNGRILANLRSLARRHPRIRIRVPLVPGVNDDPDHLARLAAFVAELGVRRLHLLPYHATGSIKFDRVGEPCLLRELAPPDEAMLERASRPFLEHRLELHIGG